MIVNFNGQSPAKMQRAGFALNLPSRRISWPSSPSKSRSWCRAPSSPTARSAWVRSAPATAGDCIASISGRYCSFAPDLQTGWEEHPADWATSSMLGYVKDLHGWATLARAAPT